MKIIDINGYERDCVKAFPDKDYPGYMRVEFKTEVRSHHVWYPIPDFIKNNPKLANLASGATVAAEDIVGVVSGSTDKELTDKKQKWQINDYAGFPIWISRGTGEGQVRTVTSNTSNTVVIDLPWDTKPNKTSQYVISRNIHEPQILNNELPEIEAKKQ